MEVISTHTNADFDTLASMIAAKKLYPAAHIVFSGSLEKKLKEGLERLSLPYKIEKIKDIDLDAVTRLILVDVRHAARIGPFSGIIEKKGLDIHIYDHHPPTESDLSGSVEMIRPYGSTTTVLAGVIRKKGIELTPEEATVLMAGIYEDTGFLTYPSTTAKDFEAAGFLLKKGADLSVVSDLLKRELTPVEVSLLNKLLESETAYTVGGIEVVIAEVSLEKYRGDISVLAHKVRDIEGMATLFMLADSGDRVHIVARSKARAVNVGLILKDLGGGGHANAASGTLKGMTLIQAKEALLSALKKRLLPLKTAGDIMSYPPITLDRKARVADAVAFMRRYNINAAPVVKDKNVEGVITRQTVDRALYHGLGASPVGDFMTVDFQALSAGAPVEEVREVFIGYGQRIIPVLKDRKVAGVITRTDILKLLQEELRVRPAAGVRKRGLKNLMRERLPSWLLEILKGMGETADGLGSTAYVVGGFVRDLLLRRENLDVDIVIEGGDGITFAREYARARGLRVRSHKRFKTAVLIFPDGFKIDVATARLEYYERPGALPTIEQSSLKLDLYRRDFIINTLAVELNPKRFGALLDFFGAQRDLKEKRIRALHSLSFVEDPTRALRAVRFSEKFGFRIDAHTLNLIKNAVKLNVFAHLSGPRLLDELKHMLEEETAVNSMKRLHELGLLPLIHKKISWNGENEKLFKRAVKTLAWHRLLFTGERAEGWLVLFLAMTDALTEKEFLTLTKRLSVEGKRARTVVDTRSEGLRALKKITSGVLKKSEIYELLKPVPVETVIYLMAKADSEGVKRALSAYITKSREEETFTRGGDLTAMGVKPGPEVGSILKALLHRKIDGEVATREDEEEFVKEYIKTLRKGK
ncbi:MAG: CBS domain-containing protein, partial [Thermodesulfobacteriota bacterium]